MDWLERVAEIRKICNVPAPARNVAIARVWVDETFLELFAFSGKLLREGAVGLPNQPMFQAFDVGGHRRDLDRTYAKYLSNPLFFVLFVPSWFIIP